MAGNQAPQRSTVLSDAQEAQADVRKLCNGVKRVTALVSAAMHMRVQPELIAELSEQLATELLVSIGFDISNRERVASVMPMMVEASSNVLASAARWSDDVAAPDQLKEEARRAARALVEVAKSRAITTMAEPRWPSDFDSITALRLTAVSAMSGVATEIAEFDYMHSASECIKEASKVVVGAGLAAADKVAAPGSSSGARLMLSQSMVTSAARVYAAVWRTEAQLRASELDAMKHTEREAELDRMAQSPLPKLTEAVTARFAESFKAVVESAAELLNNDTVKPKRLAGFRAR